MGRTDGAVALLKCLQESGEGAIRQAEAPRAYENQDKPSTSTPVVAQVSPRREVLLTTGRILESKTP